MAPPNLSIVPKYQPEPMTPERDFKTRNQVDGLMQRLEGLRTDSTSRKVQIEDRWLDDLRLFHGRYDATIEARLRANKQSRLFVNQTRAKTNSWGARLSDMLFPTDENNWGIKPTPVPVLGRKLKKIELAAVAAAGEASDAAAAGNPQMEAAAVQRGQTLAQHAKQHDDEMKIAKEAAENMERTISDQFVECDYNARNREAIESACKLGTGIIKGPMSKHRARMGWAKTEGGYQLASTEDPRPEYLLVDPWNFYPDMDSTRPKDSEYSFERHLLNDRELRRWGNIPGFDRDVIRDVLQGGMKDAMPWQIVQMREITSNTIGITQARFCAWEYHGLVTASELELLARYGGDRMTLNAINKDPLEEYPCLIWSTDNRMVKWAQNPLDSGDSLYSVYNFERDPGSMFGFGVPYLMRDSQSALNAAWRMIMDNAALTVCGQIVIDKDRVEPADGTYTIQAKKIWYKKAGATAADTQQAFQYVDIPIRTAELERIITLAKQFMDDETNMPQIAQGESGSAVTKTAQGMAMLMNSVNVIFRRSVKNFDDQMTVPNVQRAYDWNMQFNKDDTVKGDFDVEAKGSSVLLVRELEATNLMNICERFSGHPILGPLTKTPQLYRRLIRAHMLPPDEIVKTDDEIKEAADALKKNPPPNIEMEKIKSAEKIALDASQTRLKIAQIGHDAKLGAHAETLNTQRDVEQGKLEDKAADRDQRDRHMAVEVGVEEKTGVHAGGEV